MRHDGESHSGPWPVKPRLELRQIVTGFGPWRFQSSLASPLEMTRPHPESALRRETSVILCAHGDQAIGSTCSRIVLVAEVDERRSALANPKDLAPLATGETWRHTRSERAPEAGSRWQSRENGGGLSQGSTRQMEGALARSSRGL
jgi:hypothetical protein